MRQDRTDLVILVIVVHKVVPFVGVSPTTHAGYIVYSDARPNFGMNGFENRMSSKAVNLHRFRRDVH
jgi:hypothetical protein